MTDDAKNWKELVMWSAKQQWKQPCLTGRIELTINLYFKSQRRRDVDNCLKLIFDGLQGVCYENDSQVDVLVIKRNYDKLRPRVHVVVHELKTS